MRGTILGAKDTAMNNNKRTKQKNPSLMELTCY